MVIPKVIRPAPTRPVVTVVVVIAAMFVVITTVGTAVRLVISLPIIELPRPEVVRISIDVGTPLAIGITVVWGHDAVRSPAVREHLATRSDQKQCADAQELK